jgi:predicted nucleic-acid-binding protein
MAHSNKAVILDTNDIVYVIASPAENTAARVLAIIQSNECFVPMEVISETVFVLEKVIEMSRDEISNKMLDFLVLQENLVADFNVIHFGFNAFTTTNLDFVDCLLIGYAKAHGNKVFTFDDQLKKKLGGSSFAVEKNTGANSKR